MSSRFQYTDDEFWVSRHPFLDENRANTLGKPTDVQRGLFSGYSMAVWNSEGNAAEELLFRIRVPHEWDGVTNPWLVAITAPSGTEDIGDKYQFQMEWVSGDVGEVLPDTITETITSEVTLTTTDAYYAHIITFEFDASTMVSGQNAQGRMRRIAASADEVTAEPIVFHWDTRWKIDKKGTKSIQGY